MASRKNGKRSATVQHLRERYIGDDPKAVADVERFSADIDIAQAIYTLRTTAGLTQRQLAKEIGSTASVICRLEDADYEGHSLAMLRRIAAAVGKRVEIRFIPAPKPRRGRSRNAA